MKINISDITFIENNKNIKNLNLNGCKNIKDFEIISKLKNLEILEVENTNISDITFIENNKNIRVLNLNNCIFIN